MINKSKRWFILVPIVVVVSLICLHFWIKNRIVIFLDEIRAPAIILDYDDLSINLFTGSVFLNNLNIEILDDSLKFIQLSLFSKQMKVKGFRYGSYLTTGHIDFDEWYFEEPIFIKYEDIVSTGMTISDSKVNFDSIPFTLKALNLDNGIVQLVKGGKDSVQMEVNDLNISIFNIKGNLKELIKGVPAQYSEIECTTGYSFYNFSPNKHIGIDSLSYREGRITVHTLDYSSNNNNSGLSQVLEDERNQILFSIPNMSIENFQVNLVNNSFKAEGDKWSINHASLRMLRNQNVSDKKEPVDLHITLLRNLPIQIDIDSVYISEGFIEYSETDSLGNNENRLYFENVNGDINNLSNTVANNEETTISASSNFMGHADIRLYWNFYVNNPNDEFSAEGSVFNFRGESINSFLEPDFKIRGYLSEMYFDLNGDMFTSSGNIKMKYEDFEFLVLKRDGFRVNSIISNLGKLFISKNSSVDSLGYRHGNMDIVRDPTHSFFEYLWDNIEDGIINTIVGNGKE